MRLVGIIDGPSTGWISQIDISNPFWTNIDFQFLGFIDFGPYVFASGAGTFLRVYIDPADETGALWAEDIDPTWGSSSRVRLGGFQDEAPFNPRGPRAGIAPASPAQWSSYGRNELSTLSNGGLTVQAGAANADYSGRCDNPIFTGDKKYWEVTVDLEVDSASNYGIVTGANDLRFYNTYLASAVALSADINVYNADTIVRGMQTSTTADVIGIAVDYDAGKIWWRINGGDWNNDSGTSDPATDAGGVDAASLLGTGPWYPSYNVHADGGTLAQQTANFGATAFAHSAPSGFTGFDSASTTIEGTVDATLGELTLAAEGQVEAQGTLAATLGAAMLAATANVRAAGTLSATLGALTAEATGAVAVQALLGVTLGDLTAIAIGKVLSRATLDATLFALSLNGAGKVSIAASLAATLGPAILAAQGRARVSVSSARRILLAASLHGAAPQRAARLSGVAAQRATAAHTVSLRGRSDV